MGGVRSQGRAARPRARRRPLTAATEYRHCPTCLTEYRAGPMICVECGTLLVAGPSPAEARVEPGRMEVVERTEDPATASLDRFALEATPVVLTSMVEEDVDALLATLDEEEIGARRGEPTGDGGVEIVVHAANLIDAQAVLVKFTGDVRLVDEIGIDDVQGDGDPSDLAVVTWTRLHDVGSRRIGSGIGASTCGSSSPTERNGARRRPRPRSSSRWTSSTAPGRSSGSPSSRERDETSRERDAWRRAGRPRSGRVLRPAVLGERAGRPLRSPRPRLPQGALLPFRIDRVPHRRRGCRPRGG